MYCSVVSSAGFICNKWLLYKFPYNGCHSIFHKTKPVTNMVLFPLNKTRGQIAENQAKPDLIQDTIQTKMQIPKALFSNIGNFHALRMFYKLVYLSILKTFSPGIWWTFALLYSLSVHSFCHLSSVTIKL